MGSSTQQIMERESGINSIVKERDEQLNKHCVSVADDAEFNDEDQLISAVLRLLIPRKDKVAEVSLMNPPKNWNKHIWRRIASKGYRERLVIAGALIAAEIDRLDYMTVEN